MLVSVGLEQRTAGGLRADGAEQPKGQGEGALCRLENWSWHLGEQCGCQTKARGNGEGETNTEPSFAPCSSAQPHLGAHWMSVSFEFQMLCTRGQNVPLSPWPQTSRNFWSSFWLFWLYLLVPYLPQRKSWKNMFFKFICQMSSVYLFQEVKIVLTCKEYGDWATPNYKLHFFTFKKI